MDHRPWLRDEPSALCAVVWRPRYPSAAGQGDDMQNFESHRAAVSMYTPLQARYLDDSRLNIYGGRDEPLMCNRNVDISYKAPTRWNLEDNCSSGVAYTLGVQDVQRTPTVFKLRTFEIEFQPF